MLCMNGFREESRTVQKIFRVPVDVESISLSRFSHRVRFLVARVCNRLTRVSCRSDINFPSDSVSHIPNSFPSNPVSVTPNLSSFSASSDARARA